MFTFAARMGVSSPGVQDGRSTGYDEKIGLIEKAIQSFQHCTERMEDRLTRLEADVFTNKLNLRENYDILQSFDTKLRVLEVREQRFDRVVNALERFLEDNGRNPELRTELSSGLQLGMTMSTPNGVRIGNRERTSLLDLPGVVRPRKNVDKLVASEKCVPILDFPERIKSVSSSNSSAGSRAVSRETFVQREAAGDQASQTPTPGDNATELEGESENVNQTIAASRRNEKSVDIPLLQVMNEDICISSSSGYSTCQKLDRNLEAVAEISMEERNTKRKRIATRTETDLDPGNSNLPIKKSLTASNNANPNLNKLGYAGGTGENEGISVQSSCGKASCETLNKNTEGFPEISKAIRTKRKRSRTSDEIEPPRDNKNKSELRQKNSLSARSNSQSKPEKAGYKCRICDKIFVKFQNYSDDQRFHIMGKLKCHLCSFEAMYNIEMWKHFQQLHPGCCPKEVPHVQFEVDLVTKPFVCDFQGCDKSYRVKKNLRRHVKSHLEEALKDKAPETDTNSDAVNTPRKNEQLKIPDSKLKPINKMGYKCLRCGKTFTRFDYYMEDQRFHIIGKLKCHLCSTVVTCMQSLRVHFKRDHPGCRPTELPQVEVVVPDFNNRPFVCHVPECAKTYRTSQDLRDHSKIHGGGKYKCASCDFETSWASNLRKHIKKVHHEAVVEKQLASSKSGSPPRVSETTPEKQNSNTLSRRQKRNRKLSKVPLKIKLAFAPSKSAVTELSPKESMDMDEESTNSETPATASSPKLKDSTSASKKKKKKSSLRSSKKKLKSSSNVSQSIAARISTGIQRNKRNQGNWKYPIQSLRFSQHHPTPLIKVPMPLKMTKTLETKINCIHVRSAHVVLVKPVNWSDIFKRNIESEPEVYVRLICPVTYQVYVYY